MSKKGKRHRNRGVTIRTTYAWDHVKDRDGMVSVLLECYAALIGG